MVPLGFLPVLRRTDRGPLGSGEFPVEMSIMAGDGGTRTWAPCAFGPHTLPWCGAIAGGGHCSLCPPLGVRRDAGTGANVTSSPGAGGDPEENSAFRKTGFPVEKEELAQAGTCLVLHQGRTGWAGSPRAEPGALWAPGSAPWASLSHRNFQHGNTWPIATT